MSSAETQVPAGGRTRQGVVLRNKMEKTVVVEVTRRVRHRMYKKYTKQRVRYKAHDPENRCRVGDIVLLEETRPLSKTKRWWVRDVVTRGAEV